MFRNEPLSEIPPEYAITLLNGVYAGTAIVLGDFTLPEICTVTNLALFNLTNTSADASSITILSRTSLLT